MAAPGRLRSSESRHGEKAEARNPSQVVARTFNHSVLPASTHPDPEQEKENLPPAKVRTGIVSVNGHDVGQMRCTGRSSHV
jgi:hypothetical protein